MAYEIFQYWRASLSIPTEWYNPKYSQDQGTLSFGRRLALSHIALFRLVLLNVCFHELKCVLIFQ